MMNNEFMRNIAEKNMSREPEVLAETKSARRHVLFWSAVIWAYILGDIQLNFVLVNGVSGIKTPWGFPIGNIDKLKIEIGLLIIHFYFLVQFTFLFIFYFATKYNTQELISLFSLHKFLENMYDNLPAHISRASDDTEKENIEIIERIVSSENKVSKDITTLMYKNRKMDFFSMNVLGFLLPLSIGLFASVDLFFKVLGA